MVEAGGSLSSEREGAVSSRFGFGGSGRGILSAFCTCLLGLGLARFAYTPLIPVLIAAGWFSAGQAVLLGAANLAGYLAGALAARAAARAFGLAGSLRCLMLLATLSLLACSRPGSFAWFCAWRLASGFAGAGLVVLSAPAVLPLVPVRHRGLAAGMIFTGIGVGMAASGTIFPLLLTHGPGAVWLALAAGGALATAVAWHGWPAPSLVAGFRPAVSAASEFPQGLGALFMAYAASSVGQVPAILFIADFVARGLGMGLAAGSHVWAAFGLGALAGPLAAGAVADRIGFLHALRALWAAQIIAAAALCWAPGIPVIALAGVVVGAGIPALVVLVLGRTQQMAGEAAPRAWSFATVSFAAGQALGAYGLSIAFRASGSYRLVFGSAVIAVALAFLLGELSAWRFRGASKPASLREA